MRFHDRIAIDAHYNGLALDDAEGERIARAMGTADVAFLGNHGVIVCGEQALARGTTTSTSWNAPACTRCWRNRPGRPLAPVDEALARRVGEQTRGERLQSELFFAALRRTL